MPDNLLTFIHISDTHLNPDPNYTKDYADYTPIEGATALIEHLQTLTFPIDFILHTGDVVYDPDDNAYAAVKDVFAPIDIPIHYIAGNHDDNNGLQRHLMGRADEEIIPNLHYEFEVNGVQVICVDSNGPAEVPAGYVPDEQLDWLDTLCTADDNRPLVIAVHHNPVPVGVPWLDNWMRITNGLDFHNIVKRASSRLVGVFHGHIHQQTTVYREGVMYSAAASPWTQFHSYPQMTHTTSDDNARPGYSVVTVQKGQSFVRRYWFDVPSLGA